MSDLRTDFKRWLVDCKGLAETTKNGRPGTVYEYLKRIDRLAYRMFNRKGDWDLVAKHIFFILAVFLICPKTIKPLVAVELEEIYQILRQAGLSEQLIQAIREASYNHIDSVLLEIWNTAKDNNKNRSAILKYYEFLCTTEYPLADEYIKNKSIYKEIDKSLSKYRDNRQPVFHVLVEHNSSNKRARTITSSPGAPVDRLAAVEVATALGCSVQTVYRLGLKMYNDRPAYSLLKIQEYMNEHFHPSNNTEMVFKYNSVDYKKGWVSAQEAADKIGCSVTKVIRYRNEHRIAYINFSKRLVRYFLPDVELIATEEKQKKQSKR